MVSLNVYGERLAFSSIFRCDGPVGGGRPAICLSRVDVTGLEMSDSRRRLTAIEVFELFVTKERRSL